MRGEAAFRAVSDGTRRGIIDLLQLSGSLKAGDIARSFGGVSRPAVSRHLRVLREAELVSVRSDGREQWYSVRPEALREVYGWVARYQAYWDDRMDVLAALVEEQRVADASTAAVDRAPAPQRLDPDAESGAWLR
jgi:DNA-binding transcriptional ArsR family regulator